MIELSLLKALSIKDSWNKYYHLIDTKVLSPASIEILKDYQKYFEIYSKDIQIDFGKFREFFFIVQHPNLDEKTRDKYLDVIKQVQKISLEDISCTQIIIGFEQQETYNELSNDLQNNIEPSRLVAKINTFCDKLSLIDSKKQEEDMDLKKALLYTDRSKGLRWRLECLNELFNGGLIKGDFGLIAGFVDMGKSSFLASEVSYMATQLKDNQWIAWLNTEGNWEQVIPRIYQATLGCTKQVLTERTDECIIKYIEKMNGNKNRIRVLNFQRKSTKDVENLIKKNPPALIVFDLLDHINGFDKLIGKEGNVTERYGALYQWARTIATEYCPVLAISQTNGDGNDELYPSITALRGSRVDKQSAATFQLIIGGKEGNSTERYLSMPKNKVSGNKGWRQAVKFDPLKARFKDY